jgi:hypothetical protein
VKQRIPKVWLAIVRIRSFARKIEADLQTRCNGLDIADWHRLTLRPDGVPVLSSRKLLTILDEGLSEDSAYRTALERDGQWPVWMQMLKQTANETSLNRAVKYAGGDNEYAPTVFLDPIEQRERVEEQLAEEQFHKEATSELYGNLGWT